jgi:hypothetical protein
VMVDVGFTQISEKGTATLFSTDVNGATGVCPRCDNESFCKPRDFSSKAWQALLVWHEVENSLKNQALCNDCYLELREILIDRADEVELAATQEPEPLTIVKIHRKRMELRKDMPQALRTGAGPDLTKGPLVKGAVTKGAVTAPIPQGRKAQGAELAQSKGKEQPATKAPDKSKNVDERLKPKDSFRSQPEKAGEPQLSAKVEPRKESLLQKVAQTVREAVTRSKKVAQVLDKSNEAAAKGLHAKKADKISLPVKSVTKTAGKSPVKSLEAAPKKTVPVKVKAAAGAATKGAGKKPAAPKAVVKKTAAKKAAVKPVAVKPQKKVAPKAAPKKTASASPKKAPAKKAPSSKAASSKGGKSVAKNAPKKSSPSKKSTVKSKAGRR